jgi:acyl-coenzyme A thioesterase PaaI-like protein
MVPTRRPAGRVEDGFDNPYEEIDRVTGRDNRATGDVPIHPARQSKRSLAAALRSLVADVVDRDLDESAVLDLLSGIEDLRDHAVGPRRPRYYEQGMDESAKVGFIDFSVISGLAHPFAIPMLIEDTVDPGGTAGIRARVKIGQAHEGPPHGVHGGVMAAIFDELLGHAQQVHKVVALTASLTVRYKSITPIDEDLHFFAQVTHLVGRRWNGQATCTVGEKVTAEAEALFVTFDLNSFAAP